MKGVIELPPSRSNPGREIRNIAEMFNPLGMKVAERGHLELTLERIGAMNANVLAGLDVGDHVMPGQVPSTIYRSAPVPVRTGVTRVTCRRGPAPR